MFLLPLMLNAEDTMSHQRLFFTDQQRQLIDLSMVVNAEDKATVQILQIEKYQRPAKGDLSGTAEGESMPSVTQKMTVFFNGYVTGRERIQIVINGMPCQAIPVPESIEMGALDRVDCPHLSLSPYTFFLNQQAGHIVVQLNKLTMAKLSQGDIF